MCVLGNGYRLSAQTSCVPRNGHGLFVWTVFSLEDTHFPPLYSLPACFLAETIVIFHQETTVYLFASLFSISLVIFITLLWSTCLFLLLLSQVSYFHLLFYPAHVSNNLFF